MLIDGQDDVADSHLFFIIGLAAPSINFQVFPPTPSTIDSHQITRNRGPDKKGKVNSKSKQILTMTSQFSKKKIGHYKLMEYSISISIIQG